MRMPLLTAIFWVFISLTSYAALEWAPGGEPSRVIEGSQWTITFAVTESTDVEVSIVNRTDSTVVRHLVAGMLGANAPAPLIPNSLSQTLVWDCKDDFRQPVTEMDSLEVRVRAGMSTRLDNYAGGDVYTPMDNLQGMDFSEDGTVYLGGSPNAIISNTLRQFTVKGEYIKTLFPVTGGISAAASSYWGTNLYDSGWSPKSYMFGFQTNQGHSPIRNLVNLIPIHEPNKVAVLNWGFQYYTCPSDGISFTDWIMNSDGTRDAACEAASRPIIATPPFPGWRSAGASSWGGPLFFAMNKARTHFFMSGIFMWNGFFYYNNDPSSAADTGFYRDGRLFKVDMATRTASVFFSLDTVITSPSDRYSLLGSCQFSQLHGVATDDSNRVYLADRMHGKILVLDSNGTVIGAVKAPRVDAVSVNSATGAIYATRYIDRTYYLVKYDDWRSDSNPSVSMVARQFQAGETYFLENYNDKKSMLHAVETDEGTLVWLGTSPGWITIYKDQGTSFSVYKDFTALSRQPMNEIFRVSADSKTEQVFLNACGRNYRVNDWSNPLIVPCSTSANQRLEGFDMTIDSDRRLLYVRGQSGTSGWKAGPLWRFALGDKLTPAPLPGYSTPAVSPTYIIRAAINDMADHGIAVAPNGNLAVIDCRPALGYQSFVRYFPGPDTNAPVTTILDPIHINNSGLKFDLAGNLYVGMMPANPAIDLPASIKSDAGFSTTIGSIYRYKPTGSLDSVNFYPTTPVVDKVYAVDFGDLGLGCTCVTARFAVDKFSRIYSPNVLLQKVTLMDFNGNQIARLGTYGNLDNIRDEVAGKAGTEGRCYVGFPKCVDATEDYIYVSDMANCALLRIKKTFALDNIPGLTGHTASESARKAVGDLAIRAYPNPFNPQCVIRVETPRTGLVALEILDMSGRLVRSLANARVSAGAHDYAWDSRDDRGAAVSAGIYIVKAAGSGAVKTTKIVLAR